MKRKREEMQKQLNQPVFANIKPSSSPLVGVPQQHQTPVSAPVVNEMEETMIFDQKQVIGTEASGNTEVKILDNAGALDDFLNFDDNQPVVEESKQPDSNVA